MCHDVDISSEINEFIKSQRQRKHKLDTHYKVKNFLNHPPEYYGTTCCYSHRLVH